MKIIVLYGRGNTGKSTAIRRFFETYVNKNPLWSIEKSSIKTLDICIRAIYKNNIIGIISHGDTEACVMAGLEFVGDCDILICASRGKGAAMELIKSKSNDIVWLEKDTCVVHGDIIKNGDVDWIREEQANHTAARINGVLQMLI